MPNMEITMTIGTNVAYRAVSQRVFIMYAYLFELSITGPRYS